MAIVWAIFCSNYAGMAALGGITLIQRPRFLVIPAYIVGITAVFALHHLVPGVVGIALAALLVLVTATQATSISRHSTGAVLRHSCVWQRVTCCKS